MEKGAEDAGSSMVKRSPTGTLRSSAFLTFLGLGAFFFSGIALEFLGGAAALGVDPSKSSKGVAASSSST